MKLLFSRYANVYKSNRIFFFKFKSLREYDDQLVKRFITHYLLFILKIQGHKKKSCSILITQLRHHNLIFEKL